MDFSVYDHDNWTLNLPLGKKKHDTRSFEMVMFMETNKHINVYTDVGSIIWILIIIWRIKIVNNVKVFNVNMIFGIGCAYFYLFSK